MIKNKVLFCVLFALLVFTSFVVAEFPSPTPAPIGGGGGASGGASGGGASGSINEPFDSIRVEINDVRISENVNLVLPTEETIKIGVRFSSEVDDTDVTVSIDFKGEEHNVFESTELFDVEEDDRYRKILYLDLPSINQEEYYSLTIEIDGKEYREMIIFYHILMDEFCEYGEVGDLHGDINDIEVTGLGESDLWYPLDEIEIEFEIDNDANEGIDDIFLEWGIYDIEANEFILEGIEGDYYLDEGEDMEVLFTFSLHPDQLDFSNERHFLFVKVYGDEGEHIYCKSDSDQIKLEIEDDFVILNNMEIVPETAMAGEEIQITAEVWNIGREDQEDVSVRIRNEDLGIDEMINTGGIDSFEGERLETSILIPRDAEEKTYSLEFQTLYDYDGDNDVYDEMSESVVYLFVERYDPSASVSTNYEFSGYSGDDLIIRMNVLNTGYLQETFLLEVSNWEDWANTDSNSEEIILESGESQEVLFTLRVKDNLVGRRGLDISVLSGDINLFHSGLSVRLHGNLDWEKMNEMLILEDIGDYTYINADMRTNIGEEGIITEYEAEYYNNVDNHIYNVEIYELVNRSFFEGLLEEIRGSLSVRTINGHGVYFLDEGDGDYGIIWIHENLIVAITVNNFGEDEPSFSQLAEAYLEKYPSDLFDTTPPTIELISPKDEYVKRTSKSSYEIDFKYKVSDESEIVSCSLIIDGEIEEVKTDIQKDVENVFSVDLDRGSYDWQIKCVDSAGNEKISETRSLKIKKRKSSIEYYSDYEDLDYETIETTSSMDNGEGNQEPIIFLRDTEVISLKPEPKEEGFFQKIINWFKRLFGFA